MQNLKKYKKEKDPFGEHTCANCSCQNVRFFLHFCILGVLGISNFWEMFFDR